MKMLNSISTIGLKALLSGRLPIRCHYRASRRVGLSKGEELLIQRNYRNQDYKIDWKRELSKKKSHLKIVDYSTMRIKRKKHMSS